MCIRDRGITGHEFGLLLPAALAFPDLRLTLLDHRRGISILRVQFRPSLGVGTVSYTHLDVYKRQEQELVAVRFFPELAQHTIPLAMNGQIKHPGKGKDCLLYTSRCV